MQQFDVLTFNNAYESLHQLKNFLHIGANSLTTNLSSGIEKLQKNQELISLKNAWDNVQEEIFLNLQENFQDSTQEIKKASKYCFKNFKTIGLTAVVLSLTMSSLPPQLSSTPVDETIHYSSYFFNKQEAFIKLVHLTEGKSHKFGLDNSGFAGAYGWNPTKNTLSLNTQIAEVIGLTKKEIKIIQSVSIPDLINKKDSDSKKPKKIHKTVQFVPKQLKSTFLTNEQIDNSAKFLMNYYEKEFLKVLKLKVKSQGIDYQTAKDFYYNMPSNQQVVLIHMTYKVGVHGLLKYDNFFEHLITYMKKPTEKQFIAISPNFEYSYKTRDGVKLHDTRVEKIHDVFFNKCATDKNHSLQEKVLSNIMSCRNTLSIIENKESKVKPS